MKKKKAIILFILLFIYNFIINFYSIANNDIIWNYGFSYNISLGNDLLYGYKKERILED